MGTGLGTVWSIRRHLAEISNAPHSRDRIKSGARSVLGLRGLLRSQIATLKVMTGTACNRLVTGGASILSSTPAQRGCDSAHSAEDGSRGRPPKPLRSIRSLRLFPQPCLFVCSVCSVVSYLSTLRRRCMASSTASRLLKALMRMKPSPQRPKPAPGVVTTCARFSSLSKNFQESLPTLTQM